MITVITLLQDSFRDSQSTSSEQQYGPFSMKLVLKI